MGDDVKLLAKFMNMARQGRYVPHGIELWDIVDGWVRLDSDEWTIGRIKDAEFTVRNSGKKDCLLEYHAFHKGLQESARCGVVRGSEVAILSGMIGGSRMRHRNEYCSVCATRYLVALQGDSWPSTNKK